MKLKCAIIDDEPLAVSLLKNYVEKTPFLELAGSYTSAIKAMEEITNGLQPDLLFLDIQMPEVNGLEFSRIIGDRCRTIFTTAFEQYAVDSYRVNALDYLLKPFSYSDFLQACEKARQWFELNQNRNSAPIIPQSIFVKSEYKLIRAAPRTLPHEPQIARRTTAGTEICTCTSLIYCTHGQNQSHRTEPHRFRENIYSHLRLL